MEENLRDLHNWLLACNYPPQVIKRGIHNAKLQGPSPSPSEKYKIPLISTHCSNYENSNVMEVAKNLITHSKDERIKNAFRDVIFINALRQPPNLARKLCNSKFIQDGQKSQKSGLFKCNDKRCKICRIYLQECNSFVTANGITWEIKNYINCNSLNIIYYLVCNACNRESYTGKTDDTRFRTNNHISGCRLGNSTNIFDTHVFNCFKRMQKPHNEPFFKFYAFLKLKDYNKLRSYLFAIPEQP